MLVTPGTLSKLIAIPRKTWENGEINEIAGAALAIERRFLCGVPLPRENTRYPLVCDRLADIALSLTERDDAEVVWEGNSNDTETWIRFVLQIFNWAKKQMKGNSRILNGAWSLRSAFVPPDRRGELVDVFDEVMCQHLSSLPNANNLRPLLERRLHAYRSAGDSGLIECISFSYTGA